ncbi:helix-turn-helix domain-containing protein [Paenibacillus radicis (ex Gao et al. 2016)]|nr:helix-turn-helix domain-containing protein [Paenibacillus radicis (ex Gao et al. 2016)]
MKGRCLMLSHVSQTHAHSLYLFSSVRKRRFTGRSGVRTYRIPAYVLCFITEGEGVVLMDGMLCDIKPFELYLLVPGMIVELSERTGGFSYYGVFFRPVTLTKTKGGMSSSSSLALSGPFRPGRIPVVHPQQILQRILQMYEDSRNEGEYDQLSLRLQLEQFIHGIMMSTPESGQQKDERLDRSIAFMEQHYIDKISIGRLAEEAGMTPAAYSRLFLKVTGSTPVEYLGMIRMNKAKELLNKSHSRVKEVAASVGFRSEFYFSRMFQRTVGVPPTIYMKRQSLRVAVASSLGFQQYLQSIGIEPAYSLDLFHYPGVNESEYAQRFHCQMEELKQSAPDLIIADHYHTDFKDNFKEIALPVILDLSLWDWKLNFIKIAELLGRESEADQAIARLELRASEVKRALQIKLGKRRVTLMQASHRTVGIQGTGGHPLNELLYRDLGLEPGIPVIGDIWRQEMPPEALPMLETEHLFIHKHHVLAGSELMYQRLIHNDVWHRIPAVKKDKVTLIDNWFAMSWTPIGRRSIMDHLLKYEPE